jgi:hypothetical protein
VLVAGLKARYAPRLLTDCSLSAHADVTNTFAMQSAEDRCTKSHRGAAGNCSRGCVHTHSQQLCCGRCLMDCGLARRAVGQSGMAMNTAVPELSTCATQLHVEMIIYSMCSQ